MRPSALVIGTQKAGTSALYEILRQHSSIAGSSTKEVHFFGRDERYLTPGSAHTDRSSFPWPFLTPSDGVVLGVSARDLFSPKAADRIHRNDPAVKPIVMLRAPAARALSAWTTHHYHCEVSASEQHEPRPFRDAIDESLLAIDADDYTGDLVGPMQRGLC